MTVEYFVEQAGLPLIMFFFCIYYGIRLFNGDTIWVLRGKNGKPLKDEKEYASQGSRLMFFYGGVSLVMSILMFVNVLAAVAECIIGTVIFGVLWKRMNDRYGV